MRARLGRAWSSTSIFERGARRSCVTEPASLRQVLETARAHLSGPLKLLQQLDDEDPDLSQAVEFVADAATALFHARVRLGEGEPNNVTLQIRRSMEAMGQALALVESTAQGNATLATVSQDIARSLALLYPLAGVTARRRRAVMLAEQDDADRPLAYVPKAPEPAAGSNAAPAESRHRGANRRSTPRALLQVDIGLLSHSHFYTGLSMDVSRGGVFVATFDPLPTGTQLTLFFLLPSGINVEAPGTVRWTRAGTAHEPPGMGVAFEALAKAACAAIAAFCEQRAPLYHDSADE
jgi:uncharacterized protein (TIGR02266 family)